MESEVGIMAITKETNVVVLAGGLGTRSENPTIPKILQKIEGRSLLEYHLDLVKNNGLKNITLLLGYKATEVLDEVFLALKSIPEIELNFRVDTEHDNQLSALCSHMREFSDRFEFFVIVLGDVLLNLDIVRAMALLEKSDKLGLALVHPNLHPSDSDVVVLGESKQVVDLSLKDRREFIPEGPTRSLTGFIILRKEALNQFESNERTITEGVIKRLHENSQIVFINSIEYFQDTGTSARLEKARQDVKKGAYRNRASVKKAAIFLDRDGTIIPNLEHPRVDISEQDVFPGIAQAIHEANTRGIPVFLVTNQPGIAKGIITERDVLRCQKRLEDHLARHYAIIDDFEFCPHYPVKGFPGEVEKLKVSCLCRKPAPGMLLRIAEAYDIDLRNSFFLGDSWADKGAAQNCGMRFVMCKDPNLNPLDTANNIFVSIEELIK